MIEINVAEFFEAFTLHDSLIQSIEYIPREMKLNITLEFCNWMQRSYKSNEPEIKTVLLEFGGITHFKIEPSPLLLDSNQIIDNSFIQSENIVKIVFAYLNDVGIIEVRAKSVSWKSAN